MGSKVSKIDALARREGLSFEAKAWLWGLCAVLECLDGNPTDDHLIMAGLWFESEWTRAALGRG